MHGIGSFSGALSRRLVDSLYVEVLVLADEARSYFDEHGDRDRESLEPMERVGFSCESLKVTTRLMHVIAWLLTQRAVHRGELSAADLADHRHRLGDPVESDMDLVARLPFAAARLVEASQEFHERISRLEKRMLGEVDDAYATSDAAAAALGPARALMHRLESAF